jgi:predicted transcriptional regulator
MAQKDAFVEQTPEILDDATVQAINEGLKSEESGRFITMAEAVKFARERREAWQTIPELIA